MKNVEIIFSILLMGFVANATTHESEINFRSGYDGNAYIFVEGDVEFSVFPDGQFDFVYVGPQKGSQITISSPNANVSFNSGYDYDTYVQYDNYGAVIQIENVPVYYDEYGRIARAGNVDIQYNNRRVVRVGGLHVIYNNYGYFSHCTGIINVYNPYYVYHPWHMYYARPLYTHVIVYDYPYRRYYQPIRYSYHDHVRCYNNRSNIAYQNGRHDFYRPGSRIHSQDGRVTRNNNFDPNRQNTMIANNGRNNQTVRNNGANQTSNTANTGRTVIDRNTTPIRTNGNVVNNETSRVGTSNIRENSNPTVKTSGTRNAVNTNNPVRSNDTKTVIKNSAPVRNAQTNSAVSNSRAGSKIQTKPQAPARVSTSQSAVRNTSSPVRNNTAVNSSRGNSSRQNNSVRTRG